MAALDVCTDTREVPLHAHPSYMPISIPFIPAMQLHPTPADKIKGHQEQSCMQNVLIRAFTLLPYGAM